MSQPTTADENSLRDDSIIEVFVNGVSRSVPDGFTVAQLLESMDLRRGPIAVERNLELVTAEQHSVARLEAGDQLEIVTLTGGG